MLGFLGFLNPKIIMWIAIAGVVGFVAWKGFDLYQDTLEKTRLIEQQKITIQLREQELQTQETLIQAMQRAHDISDAERIELEKRLEDLDDISDIAKGSADENDGAIAPVLGDVLRALRERYP